MDFMDFTDFTDFIVTGKSRQQDRKTIRVSETVIRCFAEFQSSPLLLSFY